MIKLPYDKTYLELPFSDGFSVLAPPSSSYQSMGNQLEIVKAALTHPIASPCLADLAAGKKNVVIISSDHTRPVPSHITIPLIIEEIKRNNPQVKITVLISTGMHRPTTPEELQTKFGESVLEEVTVLNHQSDKDEDMVFLGLLPSGGELWLNRLALEADLLIAEGFIEPHFFAGFSGGRKSVLPGIASQRTVLYNHNAKFIDSPYARTGILDNNPINKDMVWAAERAGLGFILNVIINSQKEIIYCVAGHPITAHHEGCEFVRNLTSVKANLSDIVISTNGGYPLDQNVYQAVKAMTAAEAAAKPGAVIIMVAGCREGLGGDNFYHQLADVSSPKETMEMILATPNKLTAPDQWQSQILARVLMKHKVIMVTRPELASYIQNMHMDYASTINEALMKAVELKGKDTPVTVIPDGVGIIVD